MRSSTIRIGILGRNAIVAFCMMSANSADASRPIPCDWYIFQHVAQSSDAILIGRITKLSPGSRGGVSRSGIWDGGTDQIISVRVDRVLAGDPGIAGSDIEFGMTEADTFYPNDGRAVLLFLTKRSGRFQLVYAGRYGSFGIEDGKVDCKFIVKNSGVREAPALDAVVAKLSEFRKSSVFISVDIPKTIKRESETLPFTVRFKNTGKKTVRIIPPSLFFNLLWARKIVNGEWNPKQHPWTGVADWSFLREPEDFRVLAPNERLEFHYNVPIGAIGIDGAGEYQLNSKFDQFSQQGIQKIWKLKEKDAAADLWFGIPPPDQRSVYVTN